MELIQKIDVQVQIRASLSEDGTFSASVSASTVYDDKSGAVTTAKMEPPPEVMDRIKAALEEGMRSCESQMHQKVMEAVHICRQVGKKLGEVE